MFWGGELFRNSSNISGDDEGGEGGIVVSQGIAKSIRIGFNRVYCGVSYGGVIAYCITRF